MFGALDLGSAGVGFSAGILLGLLVALALGRRGEPWHLDWRLRVERGGPERALERPESDETVPPGTTTARDRHSSI